MNKIYGKYRAVVTNVNDPECMGRVMVNCPALFGETESNWCFICVPFASTSSGIWFPPNVGDLVWLEFEGGDTRYPIVTGYWFKSQSSPVSNAGGVYLDNTKRYRIYTPKGNLIELNDIDGQEAVTISSKDGTTLTMSNNKVTITGDVEVSGTVKASNI
jgi:uncharacterized protein involved in type VI secretion and phage assembly